MTERHRWKLDSVERLRDHAEGVDLLSWRFDDLRVPITMPDRSNDAEFPMWEHITDASTDPGSSRSNFMKKMVRMVITEVVQAGFGLDRLVGHEFYVTLENGFLTDIRPIQPFRNLEGITRLPTRSEMYVLSECGY